MDINYEIKFHTDWHCGAGLSAGADVDALVIKNAVNLPYVPGKTIKGLVREAVEEIRAMKKQEGDDVLKAFGTECTPSGDGKQGSMFFSDAELSEAESKAIVANNLTRFMYRSLASTAIGEDGTAVEHSLRKIQVSVPCVLAGRILNVPEDMADEITLALKFIKRLGQNRNRGLGRCTFTVK